MVFVFSYSVFRTARMDGIKACLAKALLVISYALGPEVIKLKGQVCRSGNFT